VAGGADLVGGEGRRDEQDKPVDTETRERRSLG
jgi:hypothetical protein